VGQNFDFGVGVHFFENEEDKINGCIKGLTLPD
jgi:hypothetical protein